MKSGITTAEAIHNAWKLRTVIPAFNVPYMPMMEPLARAIKDTRIFGLIEVARLEWIKFRAESPSAVYKEFISLAGNEPCIRLHLDHVPVIDEDGKRVDYMSIINEALALGYQSVMIDGSRLSLAENISAVKNVVSAAHRYGIPVEAELGAVLGHEAGPALDYEEIFTSGKGFTDTDEARRFVEETKIDWLSVAAGNIHGAIESSLKNSKKPEARLNIRHIEKVESAVNIPLVLHGGTGIKKEFIREGIKAGITKINIGTAVRKPYENGIGRSLKFAQEEVYRAAVHVITDELGIRDSAAKICGNVK